MLEGVREGRYSQHDASRLDFTYAIERVKILLQALPENVTDIMQSLVSMEFDIQ
jgi:hypothetical protein